MRYKLYAITLVALSWILLVYYYYEEIVVSSCSYTKDTPKSHTIKCTNTDYDSLQTPPTLSNIGIAFVILLHNLKTIKTALVSIQILQSPKNYFVIHVDRKVPEEDMQYLETQIRKRNLKNVQIISTQLGRWGGMELVYAAMDGMTRAFFDYPDWHYVALMSGDCFPIKPLSQIQERMVNFWPKNSLSITDQTVTSYDKANAFKKLRFKLKDKETFNQKVAGLETVYFGTQWVTLTRPFMEWVLTESFPRNFLTYLTRNHLDLDPATGMPSAYDETFFQSLIMNSPFKDQVGGGRGQCFRYEKWGYCKYTHADRAIPCMLGEDDTKDFNDTECLFARKFVHGHLPTLITSMQHPKYDD